AGSELHGGLLNGGFWHSHRLRRNRPANHSKLGTQQSDLNISSRMRNSASHSPRAASLRRLSRLLQEHVRIEQGRERAADEGSDPIDVPIVKETGDHGGTEPPRGVHRRAGGVYTHQDNR